MLAVLSHNSFSEPGLTLIQPKLTINTLGDMYEQEADAMAGRVMRMSSNEAVKPVTGLIGKSLQRKCAHCEEEESRRKPVMRKAKAGNSGTSVSSSFAASLNASKGGGSPMAQGTRSFMENAFSTDFSHVRVHNGSEASDMSQGINGKAFTHGADIYFNSGEYQPNTESGKYLLAHELTHTVQQGENIKRKISYITPTPTEKDPVAQIMNKQKLGKTYPTFNNVILPDIPIGSDTKTARPPIISAITPSNLSITKTANTFTAKVDNNDINMSISALMETIRPAINNKWIGSCPPLPIPSEFSTTCTSTSSVPVEMSGFPNLYNKVITHETEHWVDIKNIANSELKPAHDLILGIDGTGDSEIKAAANWDTKLSAIATDIANKIDSFLIKLGDAVKVYDNPTTGTHFTHTDTKTDSTCSNVSIKP